MKNSLMTKASNAISKFKMGFASGCASGMVMLNNISAKAEGIAGFDDVSITDSELTAEDASGLMGGVIGIILTIMRYAGIVLVIYGIYEIIMSIMNNQPEAKTKGIFMALAGIVLIALKSILGGSGLGLIN